ncbi:MAG: hypothetical protein J5365_02330 [Erysipelotrichaceae bacterium]|nr:hypothetical protein [Erysipelotrichaceae bacterium]
MAKITVIRPKKMLQGGVSLYIYCDDQNVGKIRNDQSCEFEVAEGTHLLEIGHRNSDNSHITVDKRELTVKDSDHITVNIGVSFTGFSIADTVTE